MDATNEFRTELLENLAEQGELPQRKPKINLDSDPVQPTGYKAPAERQTLPSSNEIAGMHKVAAKVNQEQVAHWAGGVPIKEEELPELAAMNELYCHALVGGKNVIVGQRFCQVQGNVLTFESPAEFKKKFLHIKKINGINRGQAFLEWPGKNFKPGGTGFFRIPRNAHRMR